MAERPAIEVPAATGGWPDPWPNVAEIERTISCEHWSLIGGLMVQIHALHRNISATRPTNDVDIILHVETARGRPAEVVAALESLGYELRAVTDPRSNTRRARPSHPLAAPEHPGQPYNAAWPLLA